MPEAEDLEKNIEDHQTLTARKLGSIASRFVHLGLTKLAELLANEWTLEAVETFISNYKPKKGEEVPGIEDALTAHPELIREVSIEEAADFLNEHPEILSFEVLDSAISQDWKVRAMVNTSLSTAGWVVRQHAESGWSDELKEKRGELLLEMAKTYRPDVYKVFQDRKNVLEFFTDYLIYRLEL